MIVIAHYCYYLSPSFVAPGSVCQDVPLCLSVEKYRFKLESLSIVLLCDIHLPKRRFSAFFKTNLDQTFRLHGVGGVAIAGIISHWCLIH
ncbi:MAG: hypothetical protein COX51_02945 [Syntrophobacteraceae bacterium CG23_combo_of_CG06-09_8_20_14_all_50_8]|nr:MAG: hypothetical protein COX51_02945 [Syntrophobacteraceae bacterium CG23_combo_of_CG06-09_8_20_14_all_50_8]